MINTNRSHAVSSSNAKTTGLTRKIRIYWDYEGSSLVGKENTVLRIKDRGPRTETQYIKLQSMQIGKKPQCENVNHLDPTRTADSGMEYWNVPDARCCFVNT